MRFPSLLGFVFDFHFVHVMHFISCHHVHRTCIRVRLMHPSISPLSVWQSDTPTSSGASFCLFFCERVLNVLGMDRDLPSGLGTPPVDLLSNFVPFGVRSILQRLTGEPQRPRVCCNSALLQNGPITLPNHFHVLRPQITIAWAKTTLHMDTPTSS